MKDRVHERAPNRRVQISNFVSFFSGMLFAQVLGIMPAHAQTSDTAAKPATHWQLRADAGLCTLIGTLSSPEGARLYIQTIPGSDYFRLAVGGNGIVRRGNGELAPATIQFNGGGERVDWPARIVSLKGPDALIRFEGLAASLLDTFAQASSLTIHRRSDVIGPLSVSSTGKATAALNACTAEQLIEWGADPAQFQPGGATPVALKSRDDWISNDKLRELMRFASRPQGQLTAILRVSISSDGHIDHCDRVEGPNDPAFEKSACDPLLAKPLFQPARDPSGKAVRGAAAFEILLASLPAG